MNPPVYGNEIFWTLLGVIGFLLIAVMKLAGALFRSRQVIEAVRPGGSGDEFAPRRGDPIRGDAPRPSARRRGRLLAAAVLITGLGLLIADKGHLKPSGTSPGTASPQPAATVTAHAPVPVPSAGHPKPAVPPAAAHAASHSVLTSGDITAIAINAILGLVAYGINWVLARRR